jgi:NitT/TauT family transport system substrate-binding protein
VLSKPLLPCKLAPFAALILLCALLLSACGGDDAPPTETGRPQVKLALNWFPEAQHGGYYAAQLHGFYEEAGVDVEILGGGPDAPVVQRVATGQVAFGLVNADGVVTARAAGAPIVALFAPYQTNPRCIVVHESTGITSIEQLADVTLALSQRPAFSHFLRARYPFRGVTVVPYHGSVTPFLEDERYAMQGYVFSEPVIARRMGADPRALMVAETGFNPYASGLVATERTLRERPEIVAAVVTASRRGWAHYLAQPERTNAHIKGLNPEMDDEILSAGVELSHDLVLDDVAREHGIGHMTAERWERLTAQMVEAGVVEAGQVQAAACYSLDFLTAPAAQ